MKYRVTAQRITLCACEVEARTEQEAIEKVQWNVDLLDGSHTEYDYFEAEKED